MPGLPLLFNLLAATDGKMRLISSQDRQAPSGMMARVAPGEPGKTNQVAGGYRSVAYWYQAEPHAAFPALPPVDARLPASLARNAYQFALFSSPVWVPAALLGLKALGNVLGRKK